MEPTDQCWLRAVPPHPVLTAHYGAADARPAFVRALFDGTAEEYDRLNRVLSLGSGGWYRRQALRSAGVRPGMRVLDVATGTGLVAREALRIVGGRGSVIGLDVSRKMLAVGRRSLDLPLVQARAERLPLADASFDLVSMGYALRHVTDLVALFREFHRVLRPGGAALLLEIGRPGGRVAQEVARLYLGGVVPLLAGCRGRGRDLMRYYWDTIAFCVQPEVILESLRAGGFTKVACGTSLGLFRAYVGRKPVA